VTVEADRVSILGMSRILVFSILVLISFIIWWHSLTASFTLAWGDERYTHLLLIVPIGVALILLDWKPLLPVGRSSGASLSSAFLGIAVILTAVPTWKSASLPSDVQLSLNMLAFVVWWVASFRLCFGIPAFRRSLFPLCFLFWLVPLPGVVLDSIVNLLQQGSAAAAYLLFAAVRVPVQQRGLLLHIPDLTLAVAPECSSIRSSLMLLVTTMVLAQLLLRSTWRKVVLIAAALPLSVAKNGLRIFTIGILGTKVDPGYLTGRLHRQGGIIFFLVALAAISLLLWLLRRGEKGMQAERAKTTPDRPGV
jgi:exosortase